VILIRVPPGKPVAMEVQRLASNRGHSRSGATRLRGSAENDKTGLLHVESDSELDDSDLLYISGDELIGLCY
jgi:hypothetical protein